MIEVQIYTHPFLKQKANERVSQKNFQVVDENLKDIKEYTIDMNPKRGGGKKAEASESDDDK